MADSRFTAEDVREAIGTLRANAIEPKPCMNCGEPFHVLTPFGWAEPDHAIDLCQRCIDQARARRMENSVRAILGETRATDRPRGRIQVMPQPLDDMFRRPPCEIGDSSIPLDVRINRRGWMPIGSEVYTRKRSCDLRPAWATAAGVFEDGR